MLQWLCCIQGLIGGLCVFSGLQPQIEKQQRKAGQMSGVLEALGILTMADMCVCVCVYEATNDREI